MSQKIIQAESQRAQEHLEKVNSFIARNYWMWIAVTYIIYPCASIISAVTEGTHIHLRMQATLGEGSKIGLLFTVVLVLLIETLKFFTGKGAVDDWQADAFIKGGVHRVMFLAKVAGFVVISLFSYKLSTEGANMATHTITASTRPPTLINKDSINALYDARLAPIQANIESYRKTTWKGSITRDALAGMKAEGKQVEQIENDRRMALAMAMQQDSTTTAQWSASTAETGNFFTVFAGIGELVCLLAIIFMGVYDQGAMAEANTVQQATGTAPTPSGAAQQPIGFQMGAPAAPTYQAPPPPPSSYGPSARRPIGFVFGASDADNDEDGEPMQNILLQHVATKEAEDKQGQDKIDYLDSAWRQVYRTYQAYFRQNGSAEANARGRAKNLAELMDIESKMQEQGIDPTPYIRRRENYSSTK
jgi:hypothetical protein